MRASRGGSLALPAFLGPTHENLFLSSTLPPFWLNRARKLDRSSEHSTPMSNPGRFPQASEHSLLFQVWAQTCIRCTKAVWRPSACEGSVGG